MGSWVFFLRLLACLSLRSPPFPPLSPRRLTSVPCAFLPSPIRLRYDLALAAAREEAAASQGLVTSLTSRASSRDPDAEWRHGLLQDQKP
jgi:hypothetical protein